MATRQQHAQRSGRSSKWCTRRQRLALYLRDGFACQYCGKALAGLPNTAFGLDHLVPQCNGGTHLASNLVTACGTCNFGRQAKVWHHYATAGAVVRIRRQRRLAMRRYLQQASALLRVGTTWADTVQQAAETCYN